MDKPLAKLFLDDKVVELSIRAERAVFGDIKSNPENSAIDLTSLNVSEIMLIPDGASPLHSTMLGYRALAARRRDIVSTMRYPDYLAAALREDAVGAGQWQMISSMFTASRASD